MSRETALDIWLNKTLGTEAYQRSNLAGDASFRKYYRVHLKNNSYVVMDAPPPEVPMTFVAIATMLQEQAVHVPEIKAFDATQGFMLLSDFGDRLYLQDLTIQTAPVLYGHAIDALLKIQPCQGKLPVFDHHFMKKHMDIFKEWYLQKHLNLKLVPETLQILSRLSDKLFSIIEEQPLVFVHQDYHSRNLMILEQDGPGILDFQDAIKGPITYDLVSLLQDGYISWPRAQVEAWARSYQVKAQTLGILSNSVGHSEFLRWMDLTGLQRHLKNLGIYTRLNYRDGKKQYLNYVPRLKTYIQETVQRYSELHNYATFFEMILDDRKLQLCAQ